MDPSRKRVLVVDGDAIVLGLITYLLTRQGYLVEAKSDLAEAAAAARDGSFDAAVVELNGLSAGAAWLSSLFEEVPALCGRVIVTGKAVPPGLPVRERLDRPIELNELIAAVGRCVVPAD